MIGVISLGVNRDWISRLFGAELIDLGLWHCRTTWSVVPKAAQGFQLASELKPPGCPGRSYLTTFSYLSDRSLGRYFQ